MSNTAIKSIEFDFEKAQECHTALTMMIESFVHEFNYDPHSTVAYMAYSLGACMEAAGFQYDPQQPFKPLADGFIAATERRAANNTKQNN